jgi:hypothetical protein
MLPPSTRRTIESISVRNKRIQELAHFAQTLEDSPLIMRMIKDVKKPKENKQLYLKRGVGCKTCKLKNDSQCQECKKSASILYEETD